MASRLADAKHTDDHARHNGRGTDANQDFLHDLIVLTGPVQVAVERTLTLGGGSHAIARILRQDTESDAGTDCRDTDDTDR